MARQRLTLPPIFNQRLKKIRGAFPPRSHPCQPLLSFSAHSIRKRRNRFSPAVCPPNQRTERSGAHDHRDYTRVNRSFLSPHADLSANGATDFLPPFASNQRSKDQERISTAIISASTVPLFFYADLSANGATDFLPPFVSNQRSKDQGRIFTAIAPALIAPLFFCIFYPQTARQTFSRRLPPTNVLKDQERMTTAITPALIAPFFLHADLSANGATDFFPPFAPNQRPERSGAHFHRDYTRVNRSFLSPHADLSANGATDFLPPFALNQRSKDQERMTAAITLASTAPLFSAHFI